jgi:hypothetical protein
MMWRAAAAAAILTGAIGLLCVDGVDDEPYFLTGYYARTTAPLQSSNHPGLVVRGDLAAGFGRARLTPTLNVLVDDPGQGRFRGLPLAGYGSRQGRLATGTHDDLYVKAAALSVAGQTGVIVSADALIIPREIAEMAAARLKQELNLGREQVYLSASHTHSSLGGWGEGLVGEAFAGPFQPGVRVWFADRIVAAVRSAITDLSPARLGQGSVAMPKFVRNRLVGKLGQVDSDFQFLVLKKENGAGGIIGSYAAHATVLSGRNLEFSGDYPGSWQRAIEEATGGSALFLAGSVGSHAPIATEPGFAGAELMGKALAQAVLEAVAQAPLTNRIAFGIGSLAVALPPLNVRLSDGLRLRPWVARRFLPVGEETLLQAFRVNEAVWVSTPCDSSGELALRLRESFCGRIGVHVTSFNGDYIGYVVSSRYYHHNSYESRLMSFFGPNVPDYFEELIRRLVQRLGED